MNMGGIKKHSCDVFVPYNRLYESGAKIIVSDTGRNAGKNYAGIDYAINMMVSKAKYGCVLLRANYVDIATGPFRLMQKRLEERGLDKYFESKQEPYMFKCKLNNNIMYFGAVNGASREDMTKTKGLEVNMKLGFVWLDEADQCYSGEHIEEMMATFNRHLRDDAKYFFTYNPPALKLHWSHEYFGKMKKGRYTERIYATWEHIRSTLGQMTIDMILRLREENYDYYRWRYLGEMVSFQGLILNQYNPAKHKVTLKDLKAKASQTQVYLVLFSVDGGVTNDSTAITANIIFRDGTTFIVNKYKYKPKLYGKISPAKQAILLKNFTEDTIAFYNLHEKPIMFIFDSDAGTQQLLLSFQDITNYDCRAMRKKAFWEDTGRLQDAIDADLIFNVTLDGYKEYATDQFIKGGDLLEDEILSYAYDPRTNDVPEGAEDHLIATMRYMASVVYGDKSTLSLENIKLQKYEEKNRSRQSIL